MSDITTPPNLGSDEVEQGKLMAILSYVPCIGLIVSIVVLVQRNNSFSLFHAKQSLTLMIAGFVIGFVLGMLGAVSNIFIYISYLVSIAQLVLLILGIVNAAGKKYQPLPIVGPFADKIFGNVRKK